jgi:hypothetical protein
MGVPVMDVMHVRMRMHEGLVKMIVLVTTGTDCCG